MKRDALAEELRLVGIEAEVEPCIDAQGAGRRRATFHARRGEDGVLRVGFMQPKTHNVLDLAEHPEPILSEPIQKSVEPVRILARLLLGLKKPVDAVVTSTLSGLDIDLRGAGNVPEKVRLALAETAQRLDLARLSLHGDLVVEPRPPIVRFGRAEVILPPGGFLQATEAGEAALAGLVIEGVGSAKRVADLFAGAGTFALRMAEKALVLAVEQDRTALAALDRAWRKTQGLKRITQEARDLFRRPMLPAELKDMDVVVFDPPRAGADHQARNIAASRVKRVVAVSCNAQTFSRDLKILADGGFRVEKVTPVDQFRNSPHTEAVAVLSR
jgi:23S rRNA (uracil1939-C5)-methyltransferase